MPCQNWSEMQAYLEKLGAAEYREQCASNKRSAKQKAENPTQYFPSEYHRQLIEFLKKNDEEGFKALKLSQGYASKLGV